jgi:uncharacterized protein
MDSDDNKALVLSWFEMLVAGDAAAAVGLIADDFEHFLPGTMPASGWHDKAGFLGSADMIGGATTGPMTFRIGDVVAEGDRVWFEAENEAALVSGGLYTNTFVMAVRVRDGKIVELKEFADTLHTFQAIDSPATRGEPKDRQSPIRNLTKTLQRDASVEAFSNT